ncbi:hypothetical protein WOC76_05190 [Methylocystis sp. IM3]|jgi:uncharacterized membrane protein YkoI|uniref:PepSY domain-containing protein n=1 Tax=unclassified Methylocystis TaxID=2625913 RepID=UPI000FAEBA8A|nr:MAG: hypothetical protein EKK29_03530 [Hyphomicrobiales bacterium]
MFTFRSALAAATIAATLACADAEEQVERAAERASPRSQCFSTAQTREKIEAHKLVDPFACMRAAARDQNGEALGARLCRREEAFIYEISVLRPDGRLVKAVYDASTGKPHSGHKDH